MEIVPADFKDTSISNNYHKEHVLLVLISKVVDLGKMVNTLPWENNNLYKWTLQLNI